MVNSTLYSTGNTEWETPQHLFDALDAFFHFDIDVCATKDTAKCSVYWTKQDDAFMQVWQGHTCWMNPPYGRGIHTWMKKAHDSAQMPDTSVVCLIPARTDTKWWQDYAVSAAETFFLRGRLKFSGSNNSAPFPSALLRFGRPSKGVSILYNACLAGGIKGCGYSPCLVV